MTNIRRYGSLGCYIDENNVISFTMNSGQASAASQPLRGFTPQLNAGPQFLGVDNFKVCMRGVRNRECEDIAETIKKNRLLPSLINKQVEFLYGKGLAVYTDSINDNRVQRTWHEIPEITAWLNSWEQAGLEMSASELALAIIKRFYTFRDFFVKWRFYGGKGFGYMPVAGMELVENRLARLATRKKDVATDTVVYSDFSHILVGNWSRSSNFKAYPLFQLKDFENYEYAAVSHHRENSVDEFYGKNEIHEGVKTHLKTSNELPEYIDSFLENSLAAKIHVVIPDAWVESKKKRITALCEENKNRKKKGESLLTYNNIEIGESYKESVLIKFVNQELQKFSDYLTGKKNQGKAYASFSFRQNGVTEEQRWKIETVDLKYKEYIDSLITYDKRVDEVILSAVGMDSSITSVSKPGMISKSGADTYYNYLLYIMSLSSYDQRCSEPFNLALRLNFPKLYSEGYRIGFYRDLPQRQEDISPKDRLNKQEQ